MIGIIPVRRMRMDQNRQTPAFAFQKITHLAEPVPIFITSEVGLPHWNRVGTDRSVFGPVEVHPREGPRHGVAEGRGLFALGWVGVVDVDVVRVSFFDCVVDVRRVAG